MASLTLTLITSPTAAYRRFEPPSTLMHISRLAPLLSATFNMVRSWIMAAPYSSRARSTTRTSTHDLRRDIGRHGLMDTVSPSLHSLLSSCARSLVVRQMYLPYVGCFTRRS